MISSAIRADLLRAIVDVLGAALVHTSALLHCKEPREEQVTSDKVTPQVEAHCDAIKTIQHIRSRCSADRCRRWRDAR
jgi:hypothetical protein